MIKTDCVNNELILIRDSNWDGTWKAIDGPNGREIWNTIRNSIEESKMQEVNITRWLTYCKMHPTAKRNKP